MSVCRGNVSQARGGTKCPASVMIEKSAAFFAARLRCGLLDLNHTRIIYLSSVVQIAKFVRRLLQNVTNFAITTLAADSQTLDDLLIAPLVVGLDMVQEPPALAHHLQQAAP